MLGSDTARTYTARTAADDEIIVIVVRLFLTCCRHEPVGAESKNKTSEISKVDVMNRGYLSSSTLTAG